jgi:hypothetical protein
MLATMNGLADFFLRAKHWQLFLLLFVLPILVEIAAIGYLPTTMRSWRDLGPGGLIFLGLMWIDMLCLIAWLWAMGSFLNSLQKPGLTLKLPLFRVALLYPPVYGVVFFLADLPAWAVLPLHLFALFCLFYCFYFVAKSLATVNKERQVSFSDYGKYLFLLYFFPIGVWLIQPRINQLRGQSRNATVVGG